MENEVEKKVVGKKVITKTDKVIDNISIITVLGCGSVLGYFNLNYDLNTFEIIGAVASSVGVSWFIDLRCSDYLKKKNIK